MARAREQATGRNRSRPPAARGQRTWWSSRCKRLVVVAPDSSDSDVSLTPASSRLRAKNSTRTSITAVPTPPPPPPPAEGTTALMADWQFPRLHTY